MKKIIGLLFVLTIVLSSCVSKKQYKELNSKYEASEQSLVDCKANLMRCKTDLTKCEAQDDAAVSQVKFYKEQNASQKQSLKQLQSALESCMNQGSTNITKLLDEINHANTYIRQLTDAKFKNDSLTLALSNKFKRSLDNLEDDDVNVKVLKGVVFVSLSDKMLFQSGSYIITENAHTVLSKISKIVNDYKDYDILIEGHTDNIPMLTSCVKDNWDLSAMRATAIARYMQNDLGVDPARITAGARSEYVPKASNDTSEGRGINRRTEIIVLPKLDEFIKMMENAPTQK